MMDLRMADANLNADALHHMKLTSAVEIQNGLKLAGWPDHVVYYFDDDDHNDDEDDVINDSN